MVKRKSMIQIFVRDRKGNREEITDMYWFEENGVHDLNDGEDYYCQHYLFEIFIDGVLVAITGDAGIKGGKQ